MSTLEHPEGEPDVPQSSEPDEPRLQAPAAADPPPDDAAAPEAEPDEQSSLERPAQSDPFEADEIAVSPQHVRHAPRYGRFATVGGLLGLALAFLLTPFASYDEPGMVLDAWGLGLLLAAILIPVGIFVACVIALVADRRSGRSGRSRRSRRSGG